MQISDMLGQYNRNVTGNSTEELKGAQSVQKMVSTVGELSAGSLFEGTVNSNRGGKVTLALGNGEVITARLECKVNIQTGSSMFFQVKSNDGVTVAIRPYSGAGNAGNPILLNALTAAGIPVSERNLAMVDAMMQEQMSVGRQSILDMAKVLNNNPGANVQTVVQMTKLGLPVTEELAAQFENYMTDRHELLGEMELLSGQIAETLGDENLSAEDSFALYSRVLNVLLGDGAETVSDGGANPATAAMVQNVTGENAGQTVAGTVPSAGQTAQTAQTEQMAFAPEGGAEIRSEAEPGVTAETAQGGRLPGEPLAAADVDAQTAGNLSENLSQGMGQETLGELFTEEQLSNLTKLLQNIPTLTGNTEIFAGVGQEEIFVDTLQGEEFGQQTVLMNENGEIVPAEAALNKDMTAGEFLLTLQNALAEQHEYGFAGVSKLFAGKEFATLLKSVMEQQWLIKPQDLKEDNKINRLYEKMDRQLGQLETAMKATGVSQSPLLETAADIRGNIEFMNQVNQLYTYIQIPLKLSGQNVNGELYVYTNKKQLRDPDAELTAFLHLDMENLGSTDVSVRMMNRQVKTNFYLSDDASYDLV